MEHIDTKSIALIDCVGDGKAEQLVRKESILQTIFDATQVGILLLDANANVTQVNDVVTQLVGRKTSELLARQPGDGLCCVHAGETPGGCGHAATCGDCSVRNTIEHVFNEGQPIRNVEADMRLVIGGEEQQLCLSVSATPLTLDGEQFALLTMADITASKRAEGELRRSETKFRTLYDSTSDAVMLLDETGFFDCNDSTLQIFGCRDKEEFCSKHPADLSPAHQPCGTDSMTLANQRIATAMQRGSNRFEWTHKRLDTGEDFAAEVLLNALELDGRQVLQAVVRDITERRRAEEALRESEQRFLDLLYAADDAILLIDAETFVNCNDATVRMLGYASRDDLMMIHPSELSPPEQPDGRSSFEKAGEMMKTAFEKGFHRFEWVHRKANGDDFPVEVSLTPITYRGKTILHCLWRDLTEHKRAEAKRIELQERLVVMSRRAGMSEVATGVLHNVGNVLNSVNVSANVAIEKLRASKIGGVSKIAAMLDEHAERLPEFLSDDSRGKQLPTYLKKLDKHLTDERDGLVEEMAGLIERIEHIKEIVGMQQAYATISGVKEVVRVDELLDAALRLNDASFVRHNVEVLREYQEIPPVTSDRHLVLQILVNLIGNAKHAMKGAANENKRLTLRLRPGGEEHVVVEVGDNGVGISEENMQRIFEHGFTTKKNGHGFGLHSSSVAAKQLGGSLSAYSDGPGCGARFCLTLPVAVEEKALCTV